MARVGLDEFVYESFYAGGSALLVFYPVSQLCRGASCSDRYCLFLGLIVLVYTFGVVYQFEKCGSVRECVSPRVPVPVEMKNRMNYGAT